MDVRVAILIPSTSRNRAWRTSVESYLHETLASLYATCYPQRGTGIKVFVGVDEDDGFYSRETCAELQSGFPEIAMCFVRCRVGAGHVTAVWNLLADAALTDGCEYMYACGDDVRWGKRGWVQESIRVLRSHANSGMTGPRDTGNKRILTQCFVHKTHVVFWGFFYPPSIRNWYCDDWINMVYPRTPLDEAYQCTNTGGPPRYEIAQAPELRSMVARDRDAYRMWLETRAA
jgi:hypothetical protein